MTYRTEYVQVRKIVAVTCDVCGREASVDDENPCEFDEFYYFNLLGGYGSVFGDGVETKCDVCQHCLIKMIGPYCRAEEE